MHESVRQVRIMISSTRADLGQYRKEASNIIKKVAAEKEKWIQLVEVSMEKETQSGDQEFAVAVSKRWVEEADWVVLILGWNYGTISDGEGADRLSVTEWEYRQAVKLGKRLFVFLAGEPDTTNEYRVCEEERADLKNWILKQDDEKKAKLDEFRRVLSQPHSEMYKNLRHFRERLEKTLKNAIEDLPPEFKPGTPLAELVIAMQPNIRPCIRKVTSIAECKTIHDQLHELHQKVIRPLRDEVLSVWKQEGTLSEAKVRVILRCITAWAKAHGGIKTVRRSIGPDHQGLRDSVDAVLKHPPLWDLESDSPESRPSRERFTELVDEFAVKVQEAFSEADRTMTNQESHLRDDYFALCTDLKHAQDQKRLVLTDQLRLDVELKKIDSNRTRVKESLANHHSWQEVHDKLEHLDSHLESGRIERAIKEYSEVWLAKQRSLVEEELRRGAGDTSDSGTVALSSGLTPIGKVEPSAKSNGRASPASALDLQHLKESIEALAALRKNLCGCTLNGMSKTFVDAFDGMRKAFDGVFYFVDKRTLKEVARAKRRVESLEKWLDGLVATQRTKA